MLKQQTYTTADSLRSPAAFRRLCVETNFILNKPSSLFNPAAFRRLCVETLSTNDITSVKTNPAAFRRLCVETNGNRRGNNARFPSRLQAAVC